MIAGLMLLSLVVVGVANYPVVPKENCGKCENGYQVCDVGGHEHVYKCVLTTHKSWLDKLADSLR